MQLFADEYLTGSATGKQFNAKAAAIHAGYSEHSAHQIGPKLLKHPGVSQYLKQYFAEHTMSAQEVLHRFTNIARNNAGDILELSPAGHLTINHNQVILQKQFIKSFTYDSNGNPKIEFHDAHAALRDIAKVLGMLTDNVTLSAPGGGPVPVTMTVQFIRPDGSVTTPVPALPQNNDSNQYDEADWEPIEPDEQLADDDPPHPNGRSPQ
jgi:hypothetical protein